MSVIHDRIADAARGWIGTRFHHQGRLKKSSTHCGGVDCLGLLAGIAHELELRDRNGRLMRCYDETDYSHTPDTQRLKEKLSSLLKPLNADRLQPGDILLLRVQERPQHLAIVTQMNAGLGIIHAYAPARAVVEHVLDQWWISRIDSAFRYSE